MRCPYCGLLILLSKYYEHLKDVHGRAGWEER